LIKKLKNNYFRNSIDINILGMDGETCKCDGCGKELLRKIAFSAYDYKCCSMNCLRPLRDKKDLENKKDNQYKYRSAFTYQSGGSC
jgi:hypothetical protein